MLAGWMGICSEPLFGNDSHGFEYPYCRPVRLILALPRQVGTCCPYEATSGHLLR